MRQKPQISADVMAKTRRLTDCGWPLRYIRFIGTVRLFSSFISRTRRAASSFGSLKQRQDTSINMVWMVRHRRQIHGADRAGGQNVLGAMPPSRPHRNFVMSIVWKSKWVLLQSSLISWLTFCVPVPCFKKQYSKNYQCVTIMCHYASDKRFRPDPLGIS